MAKSTGVDVLFSLRILVRTEAEKYFQRCNEIFEIAYNFRKEKKYIEKYVCYINWIIRICCTTFYSNRLCMTHQKLLSIKIGCIYYYVKVAETLDLEGMISFCRGMY